MLQIDGLENLKRGTDFSYDVPAPLGPNGGPAVLSIKAKPSLLDNEQHIEMQVALEMAKRRDDEREKFLETVEDETEKVKRRTEDSRFFLKKMAGIIYDFCVIEWSTTIQAKGGQDVEATRENFIELATFEYPALAEVFDQFKKDIARLEAFDSHSEADD